MCEQERRMMICIFAMIALIFISPTLGVHLHARVCVVFYFQLPSLCVPAFPAFKRAFLPAFVRLLIHLL
jgi:hypothetical protein